MVNYVCGFNPSETGKYFEGVPVIPPLIALHLSPVPVAWSDWEYFYSPLDGMLVHCRFSPNIEFSITNLYTWLERVSMSIVRSIILLPCEQLVSPTPTLCCKQERNHCFIEITRSWLGHGCHFDLRVITQWANLRAAVLLVCVCVQKFQIKLVFLVQSDLFVTGAGQNSKEQPVDHSGFSLLIA